MAMRNLAKRILSALAAVILAGGPIPSWGGATEAELKAAFIQNFTKFVEWPGSQGDLLVCLAGSGRDAVFDALRDKDGETVRPGRVLRVRSVSPSENHRACHVLVVSENVADQFESILGHLEGVPVLTINGSSRFLDAGGIIGLFPEGGKMRFDINLGAARRSNLALSSNLLKLARVVRQ